VFALVGWYWFTPWPVAAQPEPDRRLELVINRIDVHDDSDPTGAGEWRMTTFFSAEPSGGRVDEGFRTNQARSGHAWQVEKTIGPLALFEGDRVRIDVVGSEYDGGWFNPDDYLGLVWHTFTRDERWGVGTHTQRAASGAYSVTYSIRPASLPDLQITRIGPRPGRFLEAEIPSGLCVGYRNAGTEPAGEFAIDLLIDGDRRQRLRRPNLSTLAVDAIGATCVDLRVDAGQHQVTAILDPEHEVNESIEGNNVRVADLSWGYLVPPQPEP
jgi:hypothetical protein